METLNTISSVRAFVNPLKFAGKRIGFVPTMGCLHDGHLSLVRASLDECDVTIVSVFVNPTQFNAPEDLEHYPRTLDADLAKLSELGVDAVFNPANDEMYSPGHATSVDVGGSIADSLEGMSRPGHFRGVALVVTKLFNIVTPHVAYFGMKDAQQALVISRVVNDLNMDVAVKALPIIRAEDGLALSSRNERLSDVDRKKALLLNETLEYARKRIEDDKETNAMTLLSELYEMIGKDADVEIDYIACVKMPTLEDVETIQGNIMLAIAASVGPVRLIDNLTLEV